MSTALADAFRADGPALIHVRIKPGSIRPLGRPTIPPVEVAERFRNFLRGPNGSPQSAGMAVRVRAE
jgi:phosphonopyruvate decarboxylase